MDKSNSPENFAKQHRAVVVAPAGCGKTELIVRSVGCCDGRQLILTHTHAGDDSLRERLRKLNIPTSLFRVETIHSFALRYASSYPLKSSILTIKPKTTDEYQNVIESACDFFDHPLAQQILKASFSGIYVDEYQDCTIEQHQLIMKLATILPCRIVGDPLQGIFSFGDNQIIDWDTDVFSNFDKLDDLTTSWRWTNTNPQLGDWLLNEVRAKLAENESIDLSNDLESLGCVIDEYSYKSCSRLLYDAGKSNLSIFVICDPNPEKRFLPHKLASMMKNTYKSIEPITSDDICKIASKIQKSSGNQRLITCISFAKMCLTNTGDCEDVLKKIRRGGSVKTQRKVIIYELCTAITKTLSLKPVYELYCYLAQEYKPTLKRQQLWKEMIKAIGEVLSDNYENLETAIWEIRTKFRHIGRHVPKRCISRTLLLKGLECEHSIVVDAGKFDSKNLYVALTRPSTKLHILLDAPSELLNDNRSKCPQCNNVLVKRSGKYGEFWGCSNYPECKHAQSV